MVVKLFVEEVAGFTSTKIHVASNTERRAMSVIKLCKPRTLSKFGWVGFCWVGFCWAGFCWIGFCWVGVKWFGLG